MVKIDRKEVPTMMCPMLITGIGYDERQIQNLAMTVAMKSAGLKRSIPAAFVPSLATLVRSMNCYYSNLIEGHATHPIDIERALNNQFSNNATKRNLQLEARAHIAVQADIDSGSIRNSLAHKDSIIAIHKQFCELLPPELLKVKNRDYSKQSDIIPGEIRDVDVQVGAHVPISPGAIDRFLTSFEETYTTCSPLELIVNCAAAHHRLLWIHPFADGNGRVARLLSHAWLLESADSGGLWSIARGLARNVNEYKDHLANCDLPRRNDLDGRGPLSEESLIEFTKFFLAICLDQVNFMEELMEPEQIRTRVFLWTEEQIRLSRLSERAKRFIEVLLFRGAIEKREIPEILDVSERHARRILKELQNFGVISVPKGRASIRLEFPAALAERFMPGLFPERRKDE